MKTVDNIFIALTQEYIYSIYDDLFIPDIPSQEQIDLVKRILRKNHKEYLLNNKSILAFCKASKDVFVGAKFDVLFASRSPESYSVVNATLKYINIQINSSREVDVLPRGYSGICLIDFEKHKPELLTVLKVYGEQRDNGKHDVLYLSQKPVLERILELMKEKAV